MEKNKQEFIEMVGAWAKKDMEVSGVLASITIAQAILESGWGTSELALHANNFFWYENFSQREHMGICMGRRIKIH